MWPSQRQVRVHLCQSHVRHNADNHILAALVFFEHLITIDREIDLFWKPKFSGAAALFLINRYLILVRSVFALIAGLDKSVTTAVSLTDSYVVDFTWN